MKILHGSANLWEVHAMAGIMKYQRAAEHFSINKTFFIKLYKG